ncbi:MAG TPA: hypothetical protein VEM93_05335 [Actinomycetota bacterium]|nr:hypothetical protein [Actinomycetota bacterium]
MQGDPQEPSLAPPSTKTWTNGSGSTRPSRMIRTSPVSFSMKKILPSSAKAMFVGKARPPATSRNDG